MESDLLLFASDQVYWIARESITAGSIAVPDQSYGWNSEKSYYTLKGLKPPAGSGPVEAIYLINNEPMKVWQTLLITEKYEIFYDWKRNILRQNERDSNKMYSLILNEWEHGYVLQLETEQK